MLVRAANRESVARLLCRLRGFTLIELMVVVGIMAIVLTMGIPLVYNLNKKAPMRKAIADMFEVCSNARAQAILKGVPVDLVFEPREKRAAIGAVPVPQPAAQLENPARKNPLGLEQSPTTPLPPGSGRSLQFHNDINIEMLDINLVEYKDAESARVRFYPNGTCDEMTLILFAGGEWKKIWLEVTTSLADVGNVK